MVCLVKHKIPQANRTRNIDDDIAYLHSKQKVLCFVRFLPFANRAAKIPRKVVKYSNGKK